MKGRIWSEYSQGYRVPEAGPCPDCGCEIIYNGNYFCGEYGRTCDWALPHPSVTADDRKVCDNLGLGYE